MRYAKDEAIRELAMMVELSRELTRTGALKGLGARMPQLEPTPSACARVDEGGTTFMWRPAFRRHPITDVPGANRELAVVRVSRALVAGQETLLRAQFPGWRIRSVSGQWIAARTGAPVVVRAHVAELRAALRHVDQCQGATDHRHRGRGHET